MPEQIISASGVQYGAIVDSAGALHVRLTAGSVSIETGDIEIGAVEIKDQSSENRQTVNGSAAWTITRPGSWLHNTITGITSGNVSAIGSVTANGSLYLTGFDASSTAEAKFTIKTAGEDIAVLRNSTATRNIEKSFAQPLHFASGTVITVQGVHAETLSQGFETTIYYTIV
jgi:hypothetical protein